ncbi:hypothetical protein EV426DRAFT_557365 [Tirmania nivea]|nr:hypothetical protein EV426DRAFT_557365 [Tirmania nivea]
MGSNAHATTRNASGHDTPYKRFGIDTRRDGKWLYDEQADYPCKDIEEGYLLRSLAELCDDQTRAGFSANERLLSEPGNTLVTSALRWLSSEDYDFGMAYSIASTIFMKISLDHQQFFSEPSTLVRDVLDAVAQKERETDDFHIRVDDSGTEIVHSPYRTLPRRVWDVRSNRVIPFSLLTISTIQRDPDSRAWEVTFTDQNQDPPEFWALSHSWTSNRECMMTPANRWQWPVALPHEVPIDRVRRELLRFGAKYVWLDVLCLRQPGELVDEETRQREWKLDVPTIGNIYRIATTIVRYFNGLGRKFSPDNWDDSRHWLQRAWTLQELRSEDITYNGGVRDSTNLWNTEGYFNGEKTTLRQVMTPLWELAQHLDLDREKSHGEIYRLVKEMRRRFASRDVDKVCGLFYLLRTTSLPTYLKSTPAGDAWEKSFHVLPDQTQLELLFDFPYAGADGKWFPSWDQLLLWPDRDSALQHLTRQVKLDVKHVRFAGCNHLDSNHRQLLLVMSLCILPDVKLRHAGPVGEYRIHTSEIAGHPNSRHRRTVASKQVHFQRVYLEKDPKPISEGMYYLITPRPSTSHNWVVCEPISWESRPACNKECICKLHRQIFRKVGVLRTDFVISLTGPDSTLERGVDCLFI